MKRVFCFLLIILLFSFINIRKAFSKLYINEIFATNASADLNGTYFNYLNWIEIYNSDAVNNVTGTFYLSDDPQNLMKWQFPTSVKFYANNYYIVYTESDNTNIYTNFKLNPDGGTVILSNSSGVIIDELYYGKQYLNVSYGRYPDGTSSLYYLLTPTRNSTNTSNVASLASNDVVFSTKGGYYSSSINLELTGDYKNGGIYYSTDGTEPNINSIKYSGSINLSTTTVIRARIIESGKVPGNIITQTYFINIRKPGLPVISLVTAPKNLWDNQIGIYVAGTNGITKYCSGGPVNWNQDWERSANIEVYDEAKDQVINQIAGIKISGACSRTFAQKSLSVLAKQKYGTGKLKYKFFKSKSIYSFDEIYLRNSGNDWNYTMFRDNMIQTLTDGQMHLDHQANQPAVIYINGVYWGILNIYEKSNEKLVEENYGIDESNLDYCELNAVPDVGSADGFVSMINYASTHNLADSASYKIISDQMDIDEYIDYMITEIYVNNTDWPGNNLKYWRTINPQSKWRWVLFDTDFGFGLYNTGYDANTLTFALDSTYTDPSYWPNPAWSTLLFRSLIKNDEFKKKFIGRFYAHINSTFNPNRVNKIIDSMKNNIASEMPYHIQKWGSDINTWNSNVDNMKNFAIQRPAYMRQFLKDYFGLNDEAEITVKSNRKNAGVILLNNVPSTDSVSKDSFPTGFPYTLQVQPLLGFKFDSLKSKNNDIKIYSLFNFGSNWKYQDSVAGTPSDWITNSFNDSLWKSGYGQLGYGDGDETTVISYGSDPNNKFISAYFRKTFTYDGSHLDSLSFSILVDDGAVVYLNGTELSRFNMPDGIISSNTLASANLGDNLIYNYKINPSLLVLGNNLIAVEVHQVLPTSSDLSFDMSLTGQSLLDSQQFSYFQPLVTDTLRNDINYTAYFDTTAIPKIDKIVINEIDSHNTTYTDEFGDVNDWFEIVNTDKDSVDLAGLYFSDALQFKLKTQIPYGFPDVTSVAPGEHKVLWADEEPSKGPLHLNFKLSKNGEQLSIVQIVENNLFTLDSAIYGPLDATHTWGRIPDETGSFILNIPTPGAINIQSTDEIVKPALQESEVFIFVSNSKMLNINFVNIKTPAIAFIFDILGRKRIESKLNSSDNKLDIGSLNTGIYIVKIYSGNKDYSRKIFIR